MTMILNSETDEYTENPLCFRQGIALDIHVPDIMISTELLNDESGIALAPGSSTSIQLKVVNIMNLQSQ